MSARPTKVFAVLSFVVFLACGLADNAQAGINRWTTNGPYGGNIHSIAISPNYATDNTVYAGTGRGHIFQSIDGGTSWTAVNTGINAFTCNSLAVSPNYAADYTLFAGTDHGTYKTTNRGRSWTELDLYFYKVYSFAFSPNYATDQTVYAGMDGSGVFKSTDGGTTWNAVNSGITNLSIISLAVSPNYATDHTVFAGTDNGVCKTTNGGTSWSAVNTGITNSKIQSLAIPPTYAADQTVYAGTNGGVFKTTNGGTFWTAVDTGITNSNIQSLAISPDYATDQSIFAGTIDGVFKTINGGTSWAAVDTGITNSNIRSLAISPSYATDQTVYAGTDIGVFKTTNGGTSWTAVNTDINEVSSASLAVSPNYATDQTVYTGTYDGFTFKSTDSGKSWMAVLASSTNLIIQSLTVSPNYTADQTVYAGSNSGGVFKTANGGTSWTTANTGLTNTIICSLAISPNYATDQTVYAGTWGGGVFKSMNGGTNWMAVNTGITYLNIESLTISPNYATDQTVYAGTYGGGVFKTTNGGASWTAMSTGLTSQYVYSLTVSPTYTTDQTVFAGTNGGVFKSMNGGTNWTAVNTGITNLNVYALAISPSYSTDQTVYAVTGVVFRTTNGGTSWAAANTGITNPSIQAIAISQNYVSDRTVYAGTWGGGVFKMTVTPFSGSPEIPHYNWDASTIPGGNDCTFCHVTPNAFLSADFSKKPGFCQSCHSAAGNGHALGIYSSLGGHPMFVNATATGRMKPTFGGITSGEWNDIPANRLKNGYQVTCTTCHNVMKKSDDPGRTWELTTSTDRIKYRLQNGGWGAYGNLTPKVYRDTTLWGSGGPTYSKAKKDYLVDPSEYAYNELSGFIKFKAQQDSSSYIYVTLDYPYLRAPLMDNALCSDCHTEATHREANCMNCHQSHNTGNLKGIREKVRALDYTTIPVKFLRFTGINSFADGNSTRDGVCEVCHTKTLYYRRDGLGLATHEDGQNYSRSDCTTCHSHATGFAKPPGLLKLTAADNGGHITVMSGDMFVVELSALSDSGYVWNTFGPSDPRLSVVRVETMPLDPLKIGAPATVRWYFMAIARGDTTLNMLEYRPWEGEGSAISSFSVMVHIV